MKKEISAPDFAAFGSKARLKVLRALICAGNSGQAISAIQQRTGVSASTLANHLKYLSAKGLIEQKKQRRMVINRRLYA